MVAAAGAAEKLERHLQFGLSWFWIMHLGGGGLMYQHFIKRLFDIIVSAVALVILAIPFAVVAILIKLDSKGPAFFRQQRMGKDGKPFLIYKFRTMRQYAPHNTATAELDNAKDKITRVGGVCRKTSIDELPQFINVLKGDMSIIGPRPVVLTETELIEMRHENGADKVLPGLTGLAQVNGRDSLSNLQKATYDAYYAHRVTFMNDFRTVVKTIWYVLLHVGIHEGKQNVSGD
ncbi:capsular polysaccharide synthesis protein [Lacticaseibacillus paracasei subsp. paracasei Lpp126]|uniref:Capsular polysaccharide synthesis protein n=1 Tax=Lacticaseibacillus paracasei subsp. paracasei Lpp126 TaxID=1256206 RepID=S2R0I0_LACPA|nr:capsular polysaccharide synthesis protein [Lacticaseibacillus paracasei subsp. paracasei Lpp126]